jgi:hypothetical protein
MTFLAFALLERHEPVLNAAPAGIPPSRRGDDGIPTLGDALVSWKA